MGMKSMDKLDVLRESGLDEKIAEAIVRTQEASEYVTKDYLDVRLKETEERIINRLLLAMLGSLAVILGSIYFVLPRLLHA